VGFEQRHLGIDADHAALFLAAVAVLPATELGVAGRHFDVEAAAVAVALSRLAFGALGVLAGGVGQGHWFGGDSPICSPTAAE